MLPRLVGVANAKELIFSGRIVDGTEAHRLGLVNGVAEDPEEAAMAMAEQISQNGPLAVKCVKALINVGSQLSLYRLLLIGIEKMDWKWKESSIGQSSIQRIALRA
jgi:enoyl-CoA hydratase/carnithine racemase